MLVSSICFALVNWCVKELKHIPVNELVFFRSVVSLSICLYLTKTLGLPWLGNNKKWLLARGVFGATALTIFFFTIKGIDLASATTIQYLSPVFTVIIAVYLFGERIKTLQWLLFLISFSGIVLIKGFENDSAKNLFIVLGIISAFFAGIAYNCIVKCRNTDHPVTVVMYFPLVALPVMGIWSLFEWVTPAGIEWLLLLIIGILTQIAQLSMTKALHMDSTGRVIPVKYIGAIWAILIGYFVFDENLKLLTYIGIILVVSGIMLNTLLTKVNKV